MVLPTVCDHYHMYFKLLNTFKLCSFVGVYVIHFTRDR